MNVAERRVSGRVATGVLVPLLAALGALTGFYAGLAGAVCFDIAWTAAALSAFAGMLAARRRAAPGNRARYTLWSMAAGSWLLGQLAWDVFGLVGQPPSPTIADAGWWGFAVLVIASMLRPPGGRRDVRAVAILETVPLLLAAVALCLAALWPAIAHSQLALGPKLAAIAYPILYVPAAVLTLHAMLGGTLRGVSSAAQRVVLTGLVAQAVAFTLWSVQLLDGTYVPGRTLLDPLWVIGLGAMGVGGLLAARRPEKTAQPAEPGHPGVLLPAGMFMALLGALIAAQLLGAEQGTDFVLRIGMLCCGFALMGRSAVLGRRLSQLLGRERSALATLAEREVELARLNAQLVEDSRRDPLTGIGNRRALADDIAMYESRQRDQGERLAVALCDVDHFKSYNDLLGHLAGDQALRMIAATGRGALRAADTAYRFGGEELLLVLRDVDDAEAVEIAERVRGAVERAAFTHPETDHGVLTVSVGLAAGTEPLHTLLARADEALYRAKRAGRNRVAVAAAGGALPATEPRTRRRADAIQLSRTADAGDMPGHVQSILAVSRVASAGGGAMPIVHALDDAIRRELSFQVIVVNLLDADSGALRVVAVTGDQEAREKLLDTSWPVTEWEGLLAIGEQISGASWLPAGTYRPEPDEPVWISPGVASLAEGAWQPEDMLALPLRGAQGNLVGVVSVDQPLLGRRPSDAEIGVLMAVVDHAGLALDHVQRNELPAGSDELRLAAVMLLAETHDLRDRATVTHARTVGRLARMTAVKLGLSESRVERIHAAGVVHDLGKLGISDAVLQKAGPLDESEWKEMHRHPEIGARILGHAGMHDIATWVRAHHERVDGAGYPAGRSGEEIPLEARILAVADSYEAMIAERPYRLAMTDALARRELERCSGTQFDPEVVTAFLAAFGRDGQVPLDRPVRRAA